jgi:hypothetical protein
MRKKATAVALALVTACLMPGLLRAQAPPAPSLTPPEAEAQEMGLTLASFCNPARHRLMGDTQSVVERGPDSLPGTASYLRSAEGTFLVLERYDQALAGHCLVLGWFGGDLAPGRYAVRQLAMATLEAEVGGEDPSFYAMAAVRTPDESSQLVTSAGSVEIVSLGSAEVTGTFGLTGFVIEDGTRTDGVAWDGSFTALEGR